MNTNIITEGYKRRSSHKKTSSHNCKKEKRRIKKLRRINKKLYDENNRVIKKNNVLIDSVLYFKDLIFGKGDIPGYKDSLLKSKMENEALKTQEFGKPVAETFTSSADSVYNAVATENAILQNQMKINHDQYSVNDQMYTSIANNTQILNYLNYYLLYILYAAIAISTYIIIVNNTLTWGQKFLYLKIVWFWVILLQIIEYVLFYAIRYFRAYFTGNAYALNDYWTFPTSL